MASLCGEIEFGFEQGTKPLRALREDLIGVPIGGKHYMRNRGNKTIRDLFVEKVAHGIDKNHAGRSPTQRFAKFLRHQPKVETLFKGMAAHAPKTFGKRLGVAMLASRADFRATSHRVPRRVRPLDF